MGAQSRIYGSETKFMAWKCDKTKLCRCGAGLLWFMQKEEFVLTYFENSIKESAQARLPGEYLGIYLGFFFEAWWRSEAICEMK